jgi:ABC-type molybdate transport system substrate-binding protein
MMSRRRASIRCVRHPDREGDPVGAHKAPNASLSGISKLIAGNRLAIANPDRDASGADAVDLLLKIGIGVNNASKSVADPESAAGVVSLLATGKARLGIVYATDAGLRGLAARRGVRKPEAKSSTSPFSNVPADSAVDPTSPERHSSLPK